MVEAVLKRCFAQSSFPQSTSTDLYHIFDHTLLSAFSGLREGPCYTKSDEVMWQP